MNIRYRVELSQSERDRLTALLSGGTHPARKLKRAQILLAADAGAGDAEIAARVVVGGSTVTRTKRRFVAGNLERALAEDPRPGAARKLTGKEEALLVATACSDPPAGRARWTLELLSDALVKLTEHESLSRETVRRRLAENDLKPWRKDMWCIPKLDAAYVACMEDVLELYAEPCDPKRPVICFDESPPQLIGEVRAPIPATPGPLERFAFEYRRNGPVNLFLRRLAPRPRPQLHATARPPVAAVPQPERRHARPPAPAHQLTRAAADLRNPPRRLRGGPRIHRLNQSDDKQAGRKRFRLPQGDVQVSLRDDEQPIARNAQTGGTQLDLSGRLLAR